MKKLFLSCWCLGLALTQISCSNDDNGNDNGIEVAELATITQKIYEEGELIEIHVSEYEKGRLMKTSWRTPDNVETGHTNYVYDNRGLLVTSTDFIDGKAFSDYEYQYDEQGRIKKMTHVPGDDLIQQVTYSYNGNTVTGTRTIDDFTETRTFHINSNGDVYKQTNSSSDVTYEVNFKGSSPVSLTSNFGTLNFEHDPTHNYKLLGYDYGVGNYKPNLVLRTINLLNGLQANNDKYITKQIFGGFIQRYEYTFNDKGLPVTQKDYRADVLTNEYTYTYK